MWCLKQVVSGQCPVAIPCSPRGGPRAHPWAGSHGLAGAQAAAAVSQPGAEGRGFVCPPPPGVRPEHWGTASSSKECQKHLPSHFSEKECGHTWSGTTAKKPPALHPSHGRRGRRSETLTKLLSATSGTGGRAVLENLLFPPPSSPSR